MSLYYFLLNKLSYLDVISISFHNKNIVNDIKSSFNIVFNFYQLVLFFDNFSHFYTWFDFVKCLNLLVSE